MNKKISFFQNQNNRDIFSGISTSIIVATFLFILYSWTIPFKEVETKAQIEVTPPLDFQELNLNNLKVDENNGGSSTANNSTNKKNNAENKITNKNGGEEENSGSKNNSFNPFGNGGNQNNGNGFGTNNGNGNGNDDRGNHGGTKEKRIKQSDIPTDKLPIEYACDLILKLNLNDNGTIRSMDVDKTHSTCLNQTLISNLKNLVMTYVTYDQKKPNTADYAEYIITLKF